MPPVSGVKFDSDFIGSPRKARTLLIPKKFRSIKASSVSSLLNPPQVKCDTASTLYLFFIAAQIPTVPGRLRVAFRFKSPLEGQFHHIVFFMLLPFNGGRISKLNSVFPLALFMQSTAFI